MPQTPDNESVSQGSRDVNCQKVEIASEISSTLVPGQDFNPYGYFNSIHIPLTLSQNPHISFFAKVLWGRLAMYEGDPNRKGWTAKCFVDLKTLAAAFQVSQRTVQRALNELVKAKLIRRIRQKQDTTVTVFVYHAMLDGSLRRDKTQPQERPKMSCLESEDEPKNVSRYAKVGSQERPKMSCSYEEENTQLKHSLKNNNLASVSFSPKPELQKLQTELQALTAALPEFVGNRTLTTQTARNIWGAATGNCPGVEVPGLMVWLRTQALGGRSFRGWGGVVNLIREEFFQYQEPVPQAEPAPVPEFGPRRIAAHLVQVAESLRPHAENMDGEPLAEVAAELHFMAVNAEWYSENLAELEDAVMKLEQTAMESLKPTVTPGTIRAVEQAVTQASAPYRGDRNPVQLRELADAFRVRFLFERLGVQRFSIVQHQREQEAQDTAYLDMMERLPVADALAYGLLTADDIDSPPRGMPPPAATAPTTHGSPML